MPYNGCRRWQLLKFDFYSFCKYPCSCKDLYHHAVVLKKSLFFISSWYAHFIWEILFTTSFYFYISVGHLETSLGTFYAPKYPLSEVVILDFRDPISRLARRFFHHLLRCAFSMEHFDCFSNFNTPLELLGEQYNVWYLSSGIRDLIKHSFWLLISVQEIYSW